MPKVSTQLARFLAFLSVIVLFAALLVLCIVFLRDAKAGAQFATMWKGIASFLPGAGIAAFIFRGLVRRMKQGGTVSHIVTTWLASEPLLHAAVWVFVVVELVTLSYFAPIYSLQVAVVGSRVTPLADQLQVISDPGDLPFNRESFTPQRATFRSTRVFEWGDSIHVRTAGARGYAEDTLRVRWVGFAPLYVLGAVSLPDLALQPDEIELRVSAPEGVAVAYRWSGASGSIESQGSLRLPRGATLAVTAAGSDFATVRVTVAPSRDTTLDFSTMSLLPGKLRISAFNEGRNPQHDMTVIIEGNATSYSVDRWIDLSPGTYRVRLERVWPTEIYYAGPFTIRIRAREVRDCRVEYVVRAPNTQAATPAGNSSC